MTQESLADSLGVTQSAVSSWERGKKQPSLSKLPDLARALGCTVDDLFRDPEYCECTESEPRPELNAVGRAEWRCAKCGGRAIGDDGEE
jgi:transcriptional regulator with XRE-family HTH domain